MYVRGQLISATRESLPHHKVMSEMDRAACKDIAGFSPYGETGQGQYSKDNLSSQSTAEIAVSYVMKALGEKYKR